MDPLSPVLECPLTDVFRFSNTKYREMRSRESPLRDDNVNSVFMCRHTSRDSENACLSVTPTPLTLSKPDLFNKVDVCWECESDWLTQQSPLKNAFRPSYRCSSLDSNAILSKQATNGLRHTSDGSPALLRLGVSHVRKVSAALKQENMPYSFSLSIRTLAQLDGTSDDGDARCSRKASLKLSPWSGATTDYPSNESSPPDNVNTSPKTPPTSPVDTKHIKKCSDHLEFLTLSTQYALPDPFDLFLDTPTPLTRASAAVGAFPFPVEPRSTGSLTTFTPRSGTSPLRPSQRQMVPLSRSRSFTPNRRPDRFIAAHRTSQSPRESFQISKSPDTLVGSERVLRTNAGATDPFSRNVPRTPPRTTSRPRPRPPLSPSRTGSTGPHNVLGIGRATVAGVNRQISNGAVWSVGGAGALSDSVAGVPNGQNGLLASGTNAPLYSSKFLARIDSSSELEIHERRLALALDLDLSSRILTHQAPCSSQHLTPTKSVSPSSPDRGSCNATGSRVWMNNEWVREGSVARLHALRFLHAISSLFRRLKED
jgi:hypothetical protein